MMRPKNSEAGTRYQRVRPQIEESTSEFSGNAVSEVKPDRPHRGKLIIFRLAVLGLLPASFAQWLLKILGWRSK